jgi:bifunctional DNase/RNase
MSSSVCSPTAAAFAAGLGCLGISNSQEIRHVACDARLRKQPFPALRPLRSSPPSCFVHFGSNVRRSPLEESTGACFPATLSSPWVASSRRKSLVPRASSQEEPFPFKEDDYHRMALRFVHTGGNSPFGCLLFARRDSAGAIEDEHRGLVMTVGGDTLMAIASLLAGKEDVRPLSINLLWRIMKRGQAISKRDWTVLHVAVVGTSGNAYIARIFFGNQITGEVAWDCDARPSDATWLAIKANAPIWIAKDVWEDCATPVSHQEEILRRLDSLEEGLDTVEGSWSTPSTRVAPPDASNNVALDPLSAMTTVRQSDPEPLKRLKMELTVALHEEDFHSAARIRDHPFMGLHVAALTARRQGDVEAAAKYERELLHQIRRVDEEASLANRDGRLFPGRDSGNIDQGI